MTRYPAPAAFAGHLAVQPYQRPVIGWSDHCVGIDIACSAILAGATVIEKHVCLPTQARPVQPWEATVDAFRALRAFADEDPAGRFIGRWTR